MTLVIDASVAVKWYLPEDHSDAAEKLLLPGFDLHAPELIFTELGNVLWKKCRTDDISSSESLVIIENFLKRDITYHQLSKLLTSAFAGANSFGQTVYDWTYLSLAVSLNARFVTADRRFFLSLRETTYKKNLMWIEELKTI